MSFIGIDDNGRPDGYKESNRKAMIDLELEESRLDEACWWYMRCVESEGVWPDDGETGIVHRVEVDLTGALRDAAELVRREVESGALKIPKAVKQKAARRSLTPGTEHLSPTQRGRIRQQRTRLRESVAILAQATANGDTFAEATARRWVTDRRQGLHELLDRLSVPREGVEGLDDMDSVEAGAAQAMPPTMIAEAREAVIGLLKLEESGTRAWLRRTAGKNVSEASVQAGAQWVVKTHCVETLRRLVTRGPLRTSKTKRRYSTKAESMMAEYFAAEHGAHDEVERWSLTTSGKRYLAAWVRRMDEARRERVALAAARQAVGLPAFHPGYCPNETIEATLRAALGMPPAPVVVVPEDTRKSPEDDAEVI